MDARSYNAIFRLACQLSAGCAVVLPDVSGEAFSVGPYRTACNDWPAPYAAIVGSEIWPVYDAFDGAALVATLASPSALADWLTDRAA